MNELEFISCDDSSEYANRRLYVIDGEPGLYRRLSKAAAEKWPRVVREAYFIGGTIYVTRVPELETELAAAGYVSRLPERTEKAAGPPAAEVNGEAPPDAAAEPNDDAPDKTLEENFAVPAGDPHGL